MPYEVRTDAHRNLLYVRLDGYLTDEEATRAADTVIAAVEGLSPGFDAITDIRTFKTGSPRVVEALLRAQQAYKAHSIRRAIRIVGENVVGKMQLQRTGRESGLDMAYVATLADAEKLLRA